MSINAAQIAEYQDVAEQLAEAEAAAVAVQPYFRAKLDVEDKGGRVFDPVTLADKAAERAMRESDSRIGIQHTESLVRRRAQSRTAAN